MKEAWENQIRQVYQRLEHCDLCPHGCGVNRLAGETGICGATAIPKIYQHFIHLGEEISLVPAFIINFAGCNLKCPDCAERHRWNLPALKTGKPEIYAQKLAAYWEKTGFPKSIEWIGGEPSIHLYEVLKVSAELKNILQNVTPTIYLNTNVYFSNDLIPSMKNIIDGFVFDFKCLQSCAESLVGSHDYLDVVTDNILSIYHQWPAQNLVLRHLMIPGHFKCCTQQIIQWCRQNVPELTFNLMTVFHSMNGHQPEVLSEDERDTGIFCLKQSGLKHILIDGEQI